MDTYERSFRNIFDAQLPGELRDSLELKQDRHSVYNARRLLEAYIQRFPQDLYQTISVEKPFSTLLDTTGDTELRWCGILDRIVTFQGGTYFLELKTTSHRLDETWLAQFKVSGQLRGYVWAGQQLLGKQFDGAIIHGVEKAAPPKPGYEKRARKPEELIAASFVEVSQEELEEWRENTLATIASVHRAQAMSRHRKNLGDACNAYNFHGCPYRQVCGAHPNMRQQVLEENYVQRVWDPLAEQRTQVVT